MTKTNQQNNNKTQNGKQGEKKGQSSSQSQKPKQVKKLLDSNQKFSMMSRGEREYLQGVLNPFKYGLGNRVPSRFPIPTTAFLSEWSGTIQTDSSGNAAFIWLPSLTRTLNFGNSSSLLTGAAGITSISTANGWGIMTDGNLAAKADSGRVVDAALLISNDIDFDNIKGTVLFTPFICPDVSLTQAQAALGVAGSVQALCSAGAVASLSMPGSFEIDLDQLINQEVLLTTRPVDNSGTDFRTWSDQSGIGNSWAFIGGASTEVVGTVSGLGSTTSTYCGSNCKGLIGWWISVSGCPVSGTVLNLVGRVDAEGYQIGTPAAGNNMIASDNESPGLTMSMDALLAPLGGYETLAATVKPFVANGLNSAIKALPGFLATCLV